MNPRVIEPERRRERLRERRFADARYVLDQQMPAGEQARERDLERFRLADDDARQLTKNGAQAFGHRDRRLGKRTNGHERTQ